MSGKPDHTLGCNSLRGGKQIYGHKTLTSNWIEESFKPGLATRGRVSTSRFVTTTAEQQGASAWQVYGAGIAAQQTGPIDFGNIIFYDKTAASKTWKPMSVEASEFTTEFKPSPPFADVAEYRETWTRDTPEGLLVRFGPPKA